jgi:elongation factor P
MGNLTDLTKGRIVKINDEPYVIMWSEFNRQQQRKPVMRSKLKNIRTGATMDKTFLSGESFELVDVRKQKVQYLYKDDNAAYFMDESTYEQFEVSLEIIEGLIICSRAQQSTVYFLKEK